MPKYRKKPVEIDAIQYSLTNGKEICDWAAGLIIETKNAYGQYLQIATLEGTMIGNIGDWVICGIKGEFYPCKPDIFPLTYESAEE